MKWSALPTRPRVSPSRAQSEPAFVPDIIKKGHREIEVVMNEHQWARLPAFIVVSRKDVAVRAYEIYLTRGAADGFDRDDWLRAEQELKTRGEMLSADSIAFPRRQAGFRHGLIGGNSM